MKRAIMSVREINPAIKIGVCGEHGGDPESIRFFHSLGVDYVSCSSSRLRIAQLAAAQVGSEGCVRALPEPQKIQQERNVVLSLAS
jgi:pyruvate,orthophosphate dikinase